MRFSVLSVHSKSRLSDARCAIIMTLLEENATGCRWCMTVGPNFKLASDNLQMPVHMNKYKQT